MIAHSDTKTDFFVVNKNDDVLVNVWWSINSNLSFHKWVSEQDLGVEVCSNIYLDHNVYFITDIKNLLLAKIKYELNGDILTRDQTYSLI